MKKMIELKDVVKKFKQDTILDHVNLELYDNRIYGFVGRNGSGKSILFKLISGYMRPDSGTITVEGKKLGKNCDFPESLGVLIESPGFLWYESGLSNLRFLAKIQKNITDEEVKEAIHMVGLDSNSKKHVGKYSLGMKQRLGIAQAVMEQPNILILDEPMNGLDDTGVDLIRTLLLNYKKEGRVILLASHNKEDIDLLCDEVYHMNGGNVVKGEK